MEMMKMFKLKEGNCEGCPYYQSPPLDFPKEQRYHQCKLTYRENLILEKINEQCPIRNLEDVLEDFMKYIRNQNYDFNGLVDFQLASRAIEKFIEGYV